VLQFLVTKERDIADVQYAAGPGFGGYNFRNAKLTFYGTNIYLMSSDKGYNSYFGGQINTPSYRIFP